MANSTQNSMIAVYTLIGSDSLKVKAVLDRLKARMQEFGDMSFNFDSFNGSTSTGQDIVNSCLQMPFASEKRFVNVIDADELKKDDIDKLIEYIDNVNETTILTLTCNKLPKNSRLYKAILKNFKQGIIDCAPPKKYMMADTVVAIARSHNGQIDKNAAQRLVELVGENTNKLDEEIQKMFLANGNQPITIEQVENQVTASIDVKPWEFSAAFASRDIKKCLDMFNQMHDGQEYILLPVVCNIVKELICVHDIGTSTSSYAIASELGCQEWKVKNHIRYANNFSKDELIDILKLALETEKKMKSTSGSALHFQTFIVESLR